MADLEPVRIPVDSSDFPKAVAQSKKLERTIAELYKALDQGKLTSAQFKEGLRQLNSENKNLFGTVQKTTVEIHKYAASVADSTTKTRAEKAAKDQLITTLKASRVAINTLNAEKKAEAAAAREQAAMDARLVAEKHSLAMAYKPLYAASIQYAKALDEITRAESLNVLTGKQAQMQIASLNKQYQDFSDGVAGAGNIFVNGATRSTKAMNGLSMATQQVGYQVGDFLVQWQSGTNVLVAFGQQATQLVGILPLMASSLKMSMTAAVGLSAGLGIVIPLVTAIGAAWLRTRDSNKKAKEQLDEYQSTLKSVESALVSLQSQIASVKFGIDDNSLLSLKVATDTIIEQREGLVAQIRSAQYAKDYSRVRDISLEIVAANDKILELGQKRVEVATLLAELERANASEKESNLRVLQAELKYGQDSIQVYTLKASIAREEEVTRLKTLNLTKAEFDAAMRLYDAQAKVSQEIEFGKGWMDKLKQSASDTASVIYKMLTADAGDGFLSRARSIMSDLKTRAEEAAAATQRALMAEQADAVIPPGDGSMSLPSIAGMGSVSPNAPRKSPRPPGRPMDLGAVSGGGRGGGGGGSKSLTGGLDTLRDYLMGGDTFESQIAQENDAYQKRLELLETFLSEKQIKIDEYNKMEAELASKHSSAIALLQQQAHNQQLNDMGTFFGSMASAMQAGGDRMVKVASVFNAAQALINSWTAYTEMLKDPSFVGRPWARFAAAASVLAAGLNAVKAIKSVGSGGSSGGGSASSATSTVDQPAAASPQTVYISGLSSDQLFSGQQLQNLFDSFYDENDKRGKVFVVAR